MTMSEVVTEPFVLKNGSQDHVKDVELSTEILKNISEVVQNETTKVLNKDNETALNNSTEVSEKGSEVIQTTEIKSTGNFKINGTCSEEVEQNALQRVVSLPLVLSTLEGLKNYYMNIKSAYPGVAPYLEAAENLTNAATKLAVKSSKPVMSKYGDTLNNYANTGLDKLEDKMPILQQPAQQVLEETKCKASSMLHNKVDQALCYTENMVDYYLPDESKLVDDFSSSSLSASSEDNSAADCEEELKNSSETGMRLGGISNKVKRRSYQKAMRRWNDVSDTSKQTLGRLNYNVNLIQYAQESLNATTNLISNSMSTVQKKMSTAQQGLTSLFTAQWQSKVLKNAEHFSKQLIDVCSACLTFVRSSPKLQNLVQTVTTAKELSVDLYETFSGKQAISQLKSNVVAGALVKIEQVNEIMLEVADKLVDYPPLTWLKGVGECETDASVSLRSAPDRLVDDVKAD